MNIDGTYPAAETNSVLYTQGHVDAQTAEIDRLRAELDRLDADLTYAEGHRARAEAALARVRELCHLHEDAGYCPPVGIMNKILRVLDGAE